jgi:hypothetical protein
MNNKQDNFKYILFLMIIFITACTGEQHQDVNLPPLDSRLALESIEVMDGFRVELFASEPLVQDPAAMEVDEFGRIYVVEMRGYPLNASGLGRVKLLEDTNGDGYPDNYTIFADSLAFPKGIMRWKNGVLVTDAPNLYYLEDSTGDGKADIKEVILTGFARSNPQHNFNTPIYGLDNWIHLANGGTIWTETYNELFGDREVKCIFMEWMTRLYFRKMLPAGMCVFGQTLMKLKTVRPGLNLVIHSTPGDDIF